MRDSMIFYRSYYEAIKDLPDDQFSACARAILEYALDDKEPESGGIAGVVYAMAKPQIDKNNVRYQNGKKGGRPKTEAEPKDNQNKTKTKPKVENAKPNVNVNVNDNDNVNDNVNVDVNDVLKENENNKKENVLTDIREKEKTPQDEAFDLFWALYPKKKSKGDARKAWKKLKPDQETIEAIMTKLPQLIASNDWRKENGQYIPYPATWLNAEGWNDEVKHTKTKYEEVDSWV